MACVRSLSCRNSSSISLTAQGRLKRVSIARYTAPIPPWAIRLSIVYRPPDKLVPNGKRFGPLTLILPPTIDGELNACSPLEMGGVCWPSGIDPPGFCAIAEPPAGDILLGSDE